MSSHQLPGQLETSGLKWAKLARGVPKNIEIT